MNIQSLCHLERCLSRILCCQARLFLPLTMLAWSICLRFALPFFNFHKPCHYTVHYTTYEALMNLSLRNQPANTISRINKEPQFAFQFASLFVNHLETTRNKTISRMSKYCQKHQNLCSKQIKWNPYFLSNKLHHSRISSQNKLR